MVAIAVWVATALLDAVMGWFLTAGGFLDRKAAGQPAMTGAMFVLTYAAVAAIVAVTLSYATVGVLLVTKSSAGRIGAVLVAGGLTFAAIPFGYVVGGSLVLRDPFDPLANAVFLIGPATIAVGYSLILLVVALVVPHGTLPSPRWRWPVRAVAALLAAATATTVVRPGEMADTPSRNPFGLGILPPTLVDLSGVLAGFGIVAGTVVGTAAVVVRYRRGSFVERQQLRWFAAAVLLAGVPIAVAPQPGIGGPAWVLIAAFGLLLVPVSVWIAVSRYRLYDIDRIISRTISYGLITALLISVFLLVNLGLQSVLSSVTSGNSLAVAVSTLLAAGLFTPVRQRVQRVVDRRFDRARYDGEGTASVFSARMRDAIDLPTVAHDLDVTVRRAIAPSRVGLWLRGSGR